MRKPARSSSVQHESGGMLSLFRRKRAGGESLNSGTGAGGCAVAEDIPVCTTLPEESAAARPKWSRNNGRLTDAHINYVVLGESGLGKTTFIYNLVSGFKVIQPGTAHLEGATTMKQFKEDAAGLRTVLAPLEVPENNTRLQVTIQDMPGWGDDVNLRRYLRTVMTYLLSRRAKDYDLLGSGGCSPVARQADSDSSSSSTQLKHSATACLYFLPPHRMKQVDLVIMSAVSQLVPVIPIIGKSDSMTESELAAYRQQVSQMLQQPEKVIRHSGLQNFTVRTFHFEQSVLKLLGLQQLPVAVNCSRHREACNDEELLSMVGPHGVNRPVQPVRQYQWGAVYPLAREHQSDILPLKRLLLGDQINTLCAMLDDSHKRYVAFSEEFAEYGEELQALAQDMYCLIKPLEYDDYPIVRANLTKVQAAKRDLQEANKQLLEKIKKVEAERKALKERVWKG